MSLITPIELLTRELDDNYKALRKSRESFKAGQIDWDTHVKHHVNLMPQIREYEAAIKKLKS